MKHVQSWDKAFREGFLEELAPEVAWKGDLEGVLKRTWLGAGIPGSGGTEGHGSVQYHNWERVWFDIATGIGVGERRRRTDDMI